MKDFGVKHQTQKHTSKHMRMLRKILKNISKEENILIIILIEIAEIKELKKIKNNYYFATKLHNLKIIYIIFVENSYQF